MAQSARIDLEKLVEWLAFFVTEGLSSGYRPGIWVMLVVPVRSRQLSERMPTNLPDAYALLLAKRPPPQCARSGARFPRITSDFDVASPVAAPAPSSYLA